MKRVFIIGLVLAASFASKAQTKKYVTFKAEIANKNGEFMVIEGENAI